MYSFFKVVSIPIDIYTCVAPFFTPDGTECSAKQKKGAGKLLKKHQKAQQGLEKAKAKNPKLIEDLEAEIASITQKLQ